MAENSSLSADSVGRGQSWRSKRGFLPWLVVALTAVMALLSLGKTVANTFDPAQAGDFHQFWYAGHFIRQGLDPYQAHLRRIEPSLPVYYVDGATATSEVAQPGLGTVVPNTAPMVLLLSVFAFFSWPVAKLLWLLCNLALAFLIPWLVLRLFRLDKEWPPSTRLIVLFTFLAMLGTRNAIGNGQTTLLVFACMLGAALLGQKKPVTAGLLLGVALSKYSLGAAGFLYALVTGRYLVAAVSLGTQVVGAAVIGIVSGTSILSVLNHYIRMLGWMAGHDGVHLAGALLAMNISPLLAGILVTVALGAILAAWMRKRTSTDRPILAYPIEDAPLFSVLTLWVLLVGYHRIYDSLLAIVPIVLMVAAMSPRNPWGLSTRHRTLLSGICFGTAAILVFPGAAVEAVWSDWVSMLTRLITVVFILQMVVSVWLLLRGGTPPTNTQPNTQSDSL